MSGQGSPFVFGRPSHSADILPCLPTRHFSASSARSLSNFCKNLKTDHVPEFSLWGLLGRIRRSDVVCEAMISKSSPRPMTASQVRSMKLTRAASASKILLRPVGWSELVSLILVDAQRTASQSSSKRSAISFPTIAAFADKLLTLST